MRRQPKAIALVLAMLALLGLSPSTHTASQATKAGKNWLPAWVKNVGAR